MTGFLRWFLAPALVLATLAGCETEPQVLGVEAGVDVAGDVAIDVASEVPGETSAEVAGDVATEEVANVQPLEVIGEVPPPACLTLIPSDVVDFGAVAPGISSQRTLTLRNDSQDPITVTSLALDATQDPDGEFTINADAAFPPTTGAGSGLVPVYVAVPVTVTFTHKQTPGSQHQTTLTVTTTTPGCEKITVVLKAIGEWMATCDPVLVPGLAGFGPQAIGTSKTLMLNLKNKGTGNCSFGGAYVEDCPPATLLTDATCPSPFEGAVPSAVFELVSVPSTANVIGPGMNGTIELRFTPKDATPARALLGVKVIDGNWVQPQEIRLPVTTFKDEFGNPVWRPNLTGVGGTPDLSVLPADVDFGAIVQGCFSKTQQVCVYATGSASMAIDTIEFVGCSPEFKLKGVPALPATVATGTPLCFNVAYAPQDHGQDGCWVAISSGGVVVATVPVAAEGVAGPTFTDTFTEASGQSVDLLFVIDDSGSMCDDQDRLKAAFAKFAANSSIWKEDFHLGVVATNVLSEKVSGKLNRGDPGLPVRYVTKDTPDAANVFKGLADLGCNGCPTWAACGMNETTDTQESGLEAVRRALTGPLATSSDLACATDATCQADPGLCGSALTCPFQCVDGQCGGWNRGFLRDDAQLEIFVFSDEDDAGPATTQEYADFLKNIKGYYNTQMMHLNAIVGPAGGCPSGSEFTAEPGTRYLEVAQQTNGLVGSICDVDLSVPEGISMGGDFLLKVQFFLTKLADSTTVKVVVNGTECTSGWKYDLTSNSVIFDLKGSCDLPLGAKIEVTYSTLCLAS